MTTQAEIDALTQRVEEAEANLKTTAATLQTELDALEQEIKSGTPPSNLDLSKLQDAITQLNTYAGEVGELKPTETATTGAASDNPGGVGQAPTKANGTAEEETTDPTAHADGAQTSELDEDDEDEAREAV